MFGIGMPELVLILVVALIVVGPKKLPDIAKSLGRAMNEFKKATSEFKEAMSVDYDMKKAKKSFDDVESALKKPAETPEPGLKKKAEAADNDLKAKELPGVKDDKPAGESALQDSSAETDDTDDAMAGTDIPAELLVNADKPVSETRVKEKGQAKDGE